MPAIILSRVYVVYYESRLLNNSEYNMGIQTNHGGEDSPNQII